MQLSEKLDPRLLYIEKGRKDMLPNATLCKTNAEKWFNIVWSSECNENRKLKFYNQIKNNIGLEPYVANCRHDITKAIARLRTSSHKLNVETGRYGVKSQSLHNKCCTTCTDQDAMEYITALPGQHNPIIEDECHVLEECPLYEDLRMNLKDGLLEKLRGGDYGTLFEDKNTMLFGKYVKNIMRKRFPENKR